MVGRDRFTMSLFIAALAFPNQDLLAAAKMGVLARSLFAGIMGLAILLRRGYRDVQQSASS